MTRVGLSGHHWLANADLWLTLYRGSDSNLGNWISEDPAGLADGTNLFAYVNNQPISRADALVFYRTSLEFRQRELRSQGC